MGPPVAPPCRRHGPLAVVLELGPAGPALGLGALLARVGWRVEPLAALSPPGQAATSEAAWLGLEHRLCASLVDALAVALPPSRFLS